MLGIKHLITDGLDRMSDRNMDTIIKVTFIKQTHYSPFLFLEVTVCRLLGSGMKDDWVLKDWVLKDWGI